MPRASAQVDCGHEGGSQGTRTIDTEFFLRWGLHQTENGFHVGQCMEVEGRRAWSIRRKGRGVGLVRLTCASGRSKRSAKALWAEKQNRHSRVIHDGHGRKRVGAASAPLAPAPQSAKPCPLQRSGACLDPQRTIECIEISPFGGHDTPSHIFAFLSALAMVAVQRVGNNPCSVGLSV